MNNNEMISLTNPEAQPAPKQESGEAAVTIDKNEELKRQEDNLRSEIDETKQSAKNIDIGLALDNARRQLSVLEETLPRGSRIGREAEDVVSELPGVIFEVNEFMQLVEGFQNEEVSDDMRSKAEQIGQMAERAAVKLSQFRENVEAYAQRLVRYTIDHSEALGSSSYEIEDVARGIVDSIPGLSEAQIKLINNADRWKTIVDDTLMVIEQKIAS